MGKGDEAKAAALIRIGEIQARAAEQQGQAWGNAIQGLGNLASKTITDYNSPEARRQREIDKGNAILKAKALDQKQYEAQRVARGNLVPGRDELQFIPATTGSNPFDAPFRNVNFGGGSTPRVTTDETFALAQAGPNGEIIENPLPNEGLRNSLSRLNAFGPTDGVLGAPPQVARPDALSRGMEGALGTTEMRRTLPTGRPDRIETYKKKAVGRYVTAGGLYDVKTAFDDLVEAGISQEVATHLAKQGLEANTIFSMADDLAEKSRKSQVAVAGSIANLALQAHAANPTSSLEDTLRSLQGPSGNRIPQDQLDQFEVAFFGKSPQEQKSILQSMVEQWDAQGPRQAVTPGSYLVGASGNPQRVGAAPVADPSAASKTFAIAQADFDRGIENGSIPPGTSFTEWSKKTTPAVPASIQEYKFAVEQGYTGTYRDYQREQASLTRGPRDPVAAAIAQERLDVILASKDDQAKLAALPPDIRTAFLASVSNRSPEQRKTMLKDLVSQDDPARQLQYMRNVAMKSLNASDRSAISGRITALRQIDDIQETLSALRQAKDGKPIPEGLIGYNIERVKNFFGKTGNPEYKSLVAKLVSTLQAYRQSMTGKAFSSKESEEYKQFGIAPENLYNDVSWTDASIRGFKDSLRNQVISQYGIALGEDYDYAEILVGRDKQQDAVADLYKVLGKP